MAEPTADPKLEEVKAVLRRLQRLSPEAANPEAPPAALSTLASTREARPSPVSTPEFPVLSKMHDPVAPSPPAPVPGVRTTQTPRRGALAAVTVLSLVAGGAAWMVWSPSGRALLFGSGPQREAPVTADVPGHRASLPIPPNPAVSPSPPPPSDIADVLRGIEDLFQQGRVAEVRQRLEAATDASADVALQLGRSYDPSVLAALPNQADVAPDPARAAHWYRIWNDRALAVGAIRDGRALERLLRALEAAK